MSKTTRSEECSAGRTMYVAFELGARSWRLAVGTDRQDGVREYTVKAGDVGAVWAKLERARVSWGVAAATPVVSCYEAGRDGFWLHRALTAHGIDNRVLDATSIERDRRAKVVKTDRVDARRLLVLLQLGCAGLKRLRVVRVPSVDEEDARQREREYSGVQAARTALTNRMASLLVAQGIRHRVGPGFAAALETLRTGDGHALGPGLRDRLARDGVAVEALTARLRALESARHQVVRAAAAAGTAAAAQVQALVQLRGIGERSAAVFVTELFAWRAFRNGREVGAVTGLAPAPYQSGQQARDQGISKAGNWRVRTMAVEIAWCWLQFQPESALARWYQRRFGGGSARQRRIGIVALARKLLIALWRYGDAGVLPEGARLKTA
jgi:transposase